MERSSRPRPRVLYLTKVLPYPPSVTGDAVYSRGLIEAWSTVAEVTVLCAANGGDNDGRTPGAHWIITNFQRSGRAGSVISPFPLIAWKGARSDFRERLEVLLEDAGWDAIVLDNIGMAHALPQAEEYRLKHPGTRLIYVSHEWEYPTRARKYEHYRMGVARRFMAGLDLRKIERWENALIRKTDIVTVINSSDLDPFRRIDPSPKYLPVPPGYDGAVAHTRTITSAVPRRVVLLGGRRSQQKQQILLDWLDVGYDALIAAGIDVVIVGDIGDDLRAKVARQYPMVHVLGFAPDLEAVIAQARAGLVVDTVGGGFKIRLLSQVFQRLPIVGLASAISGLPTREGDGYAAAATIEELVDLVCEIIDQPERLDALQQRAFADCASEFSWAQRAAKLAAVLGPSADQVLL